MTPDAAERVLALIALREAQEELRHSGGWAVAVTHENGLGGVLTLWGPYSEPAAALELAATVESELNIDGEEGFRCHVCPLRSVT